jgi:4-amino-4-deoxy-L-arabinose transferase-like glycosyltransferase
MTKNFSRRSVMVALVLVVFCGLIQFSGIRANPPGFFIDESSIAFNAYKIAATGRDEHGESWPLYFRAFGEFKNPVYVYLLVGVFRLTGPSNLAARALSATAGLLTVLLLGWLAYEITKNLTVGLLFSLLALLTPWLFELSRLVMEVAIYPLATVLFLLAVWSASRKPKWGIAQIFTLAVTLSLLTYSYSIGRLLAPLLAVGLLIFTTRSRLVGIILTWITYIITLIPLFSFQQNHPGALTGRFRFVTFVTPESSWLVVAREFLKHFFANLNPWRLFVIESSKVNEIVHIPGPPVLLTVSIALIVGSIFLLFRFRKLNAWWCFIVYGLLVSVVPASLTNEHFHLLRLASAPVFLLVLSLPTFKWMTESDQRAGRVALIATVALITLQGLWFQWRYHKSVASPQRLHTFDADYPSKILPTALEFAGSQPVYLADNSGRPGYIQALWYGTLKGLPLEKFVSLGFDKSAPENGVVITTEAYCPRCKVLVESEPYTTYIALGKPRELTALPDIAMRAELSMSNPPQQLRVGQKIQLSISVKNASNTPWAAGDRSGAPFRVAVGNHWLDRDGKVIVNDDGRNPLPRDLPPGATLTMPLTINAPRRSGQYLLELDLLQEGVSWFGLRGSNTWRGLVEITE